MKVLLSQKATAALREYKMLDGVSCVIVALSGGADSMSLLHFLTTHREELHIEVEAAHLNHCLRGEESERDAHFAADVCRALGVKLHTRRISIADKAQQRKISCEECGRQERYRFFEALCNNRDGCIAATAHTASDNAETVLLNIIRGCGLDGLCGIPPKRDGVIRPLINCTRDDVEQYCNENGIPFVTDSTNRTDTYSRNRLRLNVLPQLRRINPSADAAINRLSSLACEDSALIRRLAAAELFRCTEDGRISLERLSSCDIGLRAHVLRLAISEKLGVVPEKKQLDLILNAAQIGSGSVELRKNQFVSVKNGVISFVISSHNSNDSRALLQEIPFAPETRVKIGSHFVEISKKKSAAERKNRKVNKNLLINCLSCGIISCDTIIRTRRSGDVFSPYGRNCTKSVKKLFSEMKLPLEQRSRTLLIANGSTVLWIEGIGVSQNAAVIDGDSFYYELNAGCESND